MDEEARGKTNVVGDGKAGNRLAGASSGVTGHRLQPSASGYPCKPHRFSFSRRVLRMIPKRRAALITVTIVAVGANAMAGKGMGHGRDGQGCSGYGQGQGTGGCGYGQRGANLTDEQYEQMDAERQAFFDATKQARQDLHAKGLALRAEMAKSDADMKVTQALQKEISQMESDLALKRLAHMFEMRKIDPDAGRGFFGHDCKRGHRGQRHHHGHVQGKGYGPENCLYN